MIDRSDLQRLLEKYGRHPSHDSQVMCLVVRAALKHFDLLFPPGARQGSLLELQGDAPGIDLEGELRRWNALAAKFALPSARAMTGPRAKKLAERLREHPDLWARVEETLKNPGTILKQRRAWFTLDFVLERNKAQRIVEGVYMERAAPEPAARPWRAQEPPRDVLAPEELQGLVSGYLASRRPTEAEDSHVNGFGPGGPLEDREPEGDGACPF